MGYAITWMKSVKYVFAFLFGILFLTACNEEHPDDLPGAVNNPFPVVSLDPSSTLQLSDADTSLLHSIPIRFDVAAPTAGVIHYRVVEGTAKAERDYVSSSTQVSFAKGERQANIEIEVLNDSSRDMDRSFRIELLPSQQATLGNDLNHTVTLVARESSGTPDQGTLSTLTIPTTLTFVAPVAGEENYVVVLPLSERLVSDAEVKIATQAGTAREGIHYRPITGQHCTAGVCSILAGEQELVFTLPVIGMPEENSKVLKLQFTGGSGIELSQNREINVTLNYSGELETPTLSTPNQLSLRMPSVERGDITYPVILPLNSMLQQEAKVEWRTVDDTAVAGTHYQSVDATGEQAQIVAAGQQEIEIELLLQHDQATTEDTGFLIQLVSADGINLPNERTIYVNIAHSNTGTSSYPRVSFPSNFEVHAPTAGIKDVRLNLALTETLKEAAELSVILDSETAELGVDYELPNTQLFFPKGSNEITIPVRLLANSNATETRTFTVELHNPLNVSLPRNPTFTVEIIDQADAAPAPHLSLSPYFITVPVPRWNVPEDISLYFQLSEEAPGASVIVQSRNGTAKAGVDFEKTIHASINGSQVNVGMTLLPQDLADTPREFELVFSDANGLTLPENRLVTVQLEPTVTPALPSVIPPVPSDENSPYPAVSFTAPSVGEDKKRRLVLPFSNVAPLAGTLTVLSENGTAVEGTDYAVTSYSPSFNIGAQEVVVELELEPSASGKKFRIILESAENLVLPSVFEERIIEVSVQ